ncbi:hypothetical protein M3936_22500 [Sutcliffiella horikoshii]|uniref:hypothetical protein n=1 Tax=Sutcliffiella horikoshii TaxID=79883 RepID=UPI00203B41F0|nr:hypothetical protein [Sutcliffiella horikoshii]MCM3620330.1 hypothetical protein [Sutcliffiella horikoshii]
MYIKYIEGTLDEIKEEIGSDILNNLYVRIGEKVQVGSTLCEVIDIVHYPEKYNEEEYRVHVFVKVIKKLPEPSLGATIAMDVLSAFLNRKRR